MNWTPKTSQIAALRVHRVDLRHRLGLGVILFALCGAFAFGQNGFVEGYVVIPSGDTVKGFIKDQDWRINPRAIKFRKEASGGTTTYTAAQMKLFRTVSGTYYESKAVMYDRSPVKLSLLSTSAEPQWERDTLLLEVVVKGQLNLYHLTDAVNKQHFFVERTGSTLTEELLNVRHITYQNGARTASATQQYKSQLRNYFSDCQDAQKQIARTEFNLTPLRALVIKYNGCNAQSASALAVQPDKNSTLIAFGFVAGVHRTWMFFQSDYSDHKPFTNGPYKNNLDGTGGISINVIFPRGRRQLSLYNELLYFHHNVAKIVEQTTVTASRTSYRKEDSGFDVSYGRVNLLFRYHRATGTSLRPYLQAGVTGAAIIRSSNHYKLTTQDDYNVVGTIPDYVYTEGVMLESLKKLELGVLAGAGVTMGRFGLECRYEIGSGIFEGPYLTSSRRSAYLLLNYAFSKPER